MAVLSARPWLAVPEGGRPSASYRLDLVTVLLGAWFVVGLLLDAWAHNNFPGLESFLTPWHAVFYSGFIATAAWICWAVLQNLRSGRRGWAAVPVGYGLGVLALPVFALAGAGDFMWHTIFGIEQDLKILFSPTHLALVTSMILIVTSPLRSAWSQPGLPPAPTLRRLLPAVLGLAFATTLVLLFLQYANALVWSSEGIVTALSDPLDGSVHDGYASPVDLVSSVAVTGVVLLAPLLLLARRWQPPFGTATIVYATVAGLSGAITEFRSPAILLAVVASGLCVDGLLAWLRPTELRRIAYLAFALLAPFVTWTLYLAAASIAAGHAPTVIEYWTGLPVVAGLQGLLLGVLAAAGTAQQLAGARVDAQRPD
jgi:hypothetical protein